MRNVIWMVVLVCLSVVTFTTQASDPVSVPNGSAPTIDGTLSSDEWDDALAIALNADSTLFIKHAHGYMYLAVHATTMGVPSPLIVRDGEIYVLHASAALGTAIYTPEEEMWSLRRSFTWQCRTRGFSDGAVAERNRFLETEGWLGTIGYLGMPPMFEYKILLGDEPLRILFLFLEVTDPLQLLSWPVSPDIASSHLEIITGSIPSTAMFDLDSWALLLPVQEQQ